MEGMKLSAAINMYKQDVEEARAFFRIFLAASLLCAVAGLSGNYFHNPLLLKLGFLLTVMFVALMFMAAICGQVGILRQEELDKVE